MDNEPFSNPLAPPSAPLPRVDHAASERSQPLTNDDFRKLVMTPRAVSQGHSQSNIPGSVRGSIRNKHGRNYKPKVEQNENVKKKKKIYEMIRKQEGDILHELAKKYRDRAKERRDGRNTDSDLGSEVIPKTASAYHAVGPDTDMDAAERRRQMIQESKYLGGDMEHTHLVKGLDYALLQKVKAEIQSKEEEEFYSKQQEEEEEEENQKKKRQSSSLNETDDEDDKLDDQDRYAIKSKKAENLLKIIFNKNIPEKNELFIQGRMAYQYDLVNDFPENEIPTTIIRSKAECPNLDVYNSISTNEIIINKLIQIWTSIRQGPSKKQRKRLQQEMSFKQEDPKNNQKQLMKNNNEDNIYDDIGEYIPDIKPKKSTTSNQNPNEKRKSYFESSKSSENDSTIGPANSRQQALELAASVAGGNLSHQSSSTSGQLISRASKRSKMHQEPESYAECYPGAPENDDAVFDSDDDDDVNDTSMGKRKYDPIMDHNENIEDDYDDEKDDRLKKSKRNISSSSSSQSLQHRKDEKAKLDREYQKINALINRRKQQGEKIGMSYFNMDKR